MAKAGPITARPCAHRAADVDVHAWAKERPPSESGLPKKGYYKSMPCCLKSGLMPAISNWALPTALL